MNRRIRWALAASFALLAAVAWWVLRAPAIERHAATPPPDVDIDPPAMRARREAAFALATAPEDPWSFAEAMAASAPGASGEKSRCGVDQRPETGEPPLDLGEPSAAATSVPKPAGPSYVHELARIDGALRAAGDPFDGAVADWLDIGEQHSAGERVEAIAQRAMTTRDPRVYALAYRACTNPAFDPRSTSSEPLATSCDSLSARRWVELDPGNGVPWMVVFAQAVATGNATAQDEAMVRMASASRFEDRLHGPSAAIAEKASRDDDGLAAALDLADRAFQKSVAQNEGFTTLTTACGDKAGGNANRAQQCQAIGELMFSHGDNLLLQAMGGVVILRATGDPTRRDQGRAERQKMSKAWSPATGLSDCQVVRDGLKAVIRSARIGELAAARERVSETMAP